MDIRAGALVVGQNHARENGRREIRAGHKVQEKRTASVAPTGLH